MLPSIQHLVSNRGDLQRDSSGSHMISTNGAAHGDSSSVMSVHVAQECIEAPVWSQPVTTCDDSFKKRSKQCNAERCSDNEGKTYGSKAPEEKSVSADNGSTHVLVQPPGSTNVSTSGLQQESKMSLKDQQMDIMTVPGVSPQDNSPMTVKDCTTVRRDSNRSNSYLPLSVELVAGRGQTSMPSNGNKSNANATKVKSFPPSHTLALSASLIKSYFSSGPEKSQSKSAGSTPESELSVKTKMMGLWNNVKYGWAVNMKTNFSRDAPVYLLGHVYHRSFNNDMESSSSSQEEKEEHGMEAFKRHFYSLLWCTYRRQFPTLQDSSLTTDCGWGCMLRSGQMMLGQALFRHFLTQDWRYRKTSLSGPEEEIHCSIVRWFGDSPSPLCPLSLHNLVHLGHKLGKKAGDWYGPASVAYIFKEAIEMGSKYIPDLQRICIYVAQDCAVYIQDVLDLCSSDCICGKGQLIKLSKAVRKKRIVSSNLYEEISSIPMSPQSQEILNVPLKTQIVPSIDANHSRVNSCLSTVEKTQVKQYEYANLSERKNKKENEMSGLTCTSIQDRALRDQCVSEDDASPPVVECPVCDNWRSVLILVPVRLGGEGLNPIYTPCIYSLFTHDLCVGIIGGRPKHSLYFVGFQEESLIHLDPHLCQDAVMVTQPIFSLSSYHCSSPRKMAISRMDPSATIGFYCHSRMDFLRLMQELPELVTPKEPGCEYPVFEFLDGRSGDSDAWARQVTTEDEMVASLPGDTPLLPQDSEEFVFL